MNKQRIYQVRVYGPLRPLKGDPCYWGYGSPKRHLSLAAAQEHLTFMLENKHRAGYHHVTYAITHACGKQIGERQ